MIRINLLPSERGKTAKALTLQVGQKLAVGCSLILVVAGLFVGWRYWSLTQQSTRLDAEIVAAEKETERLRSILKDVADFEERRAQLSQRVVLIEQLRREQTGPVHMLDQISRALPPMLWLTGLKQAGSDVVLDGDSTTLNGLSDFVANLEASGYFKRSIEIVSTTTQAMPKGPGELIKFSIRAQFQTPGETKPAVAADSAPRTDGNTAAGASPR
jgi:type IV pilus assembly protein PilN